MKFISMLSIRRDVNFVFSVLSGLVIYISILFWDDGTTFEIFTALCFGTLFLIFDESLRTKKFWMSLPFAVSIFTYALLWLDIVGGYLLHIYIVLGLVGIFFVIPGQSADLITSPMKSLEKVLLLFSAYLGTTLIYLLIYSLFMAVESLFNVSLPRGVRYLPVLITPLLFISMMAAFSEKGFLSDDRLGRLVSQLLKFVLIPILAIYALVLLGYEGSLLIYQTTPEGFATWPATIALSVWFFIQSFKGPELNAHWLKKLLPLPAVILLTYGVSVRILNYGLTPERVYLLFWVVLAISTVVFFVWKGIFNFKRIVLTMILFFTVTMIPIVDPDHLSTWSQWSRFEKGLKNIPDNNLKTISGDHVVLEQPHSALGVILKTMDIKEVKAKMLGAFPSLSESEVEVLYQKVLNKKNASKVGSKNGYEPCIHVDYVDAPKKVPTYEWVTHFDSEVTTVNMGDNPAIFEIDSRTAVLKIGTKAHGFKSFNLKELVPNQVKGPVIFSGNSGSLKYEVWLEKGFICPTERSSMEGKIFFSLNGT